MYVYTICTRKYKIFFQQILHGFWSFPSFEWSADCWRRIWIAVQNRNSSLKNSSWILVFCIFVEHNLVSHSELCASFGAFLSHIKTCKRTMETRIMLISQTSAYPVFGFLLSQHWLYFWMFAFFYFIIEQCWYKSQQILPIVDLV